MFKSVNEFTRYIEFSRLILKYLIIIRRSSNVSYLFVLFCCVVDVFCLAADGKKFDAAYWQ